MINRRLLPCLLVALSACNLVETTDNENTVGRGSKAFDPYTGQSGARRLALQQFMGCAVAPSGHPIAKGDAPIPYPAMCPDMNFADPFLPGFDPVPPSERLQIVTKSQYFLNQITLMDQKVDVPLDPATFGIDDAKLQALYSDRLAPTNWIKRDSMFAGLDWSGLSLGNDRWVGTPAPGQWNREVVYANAAWMNERASTLHVELLDSTGTVRREQTYNRSEFLAENQQSGHSQVSWTVQNLSHPNIPNDPVAHPTADGRTPVAIFTTVRIEFFGSINPFKQIEIPDLTGDGAFRVTWSLMPDKPFYFPVTFVRAEDLPATCFGPDGGASVCGAGLNPTARFTKPENGKFYQPGETFTFRAEIKDDEGNLLHAPDSLPSFNDFISGNSNGLIYYNQGRTNYFERDQEPTWQVMGPLQNAADYPDVTSPPPYALYPPRPGGGEEVGVFVPPFAGLGVGIGAADTRWSNSYPVTIPAEAAPGTYALYMKVNRSILGERVAKANAVYFQVGQEEKTSYPGQVGNCQICHRGVISLDNLRHGFSVNDVEGCKSCHKTIFGNFGADVHQIHMNSSKFPFQKNQCVTCHLTRKSAIKASYDVCSSCHPAPHGDQFFAIQFAQYGSPNRFSSCAQACHENTPPVNHILPQN